ncbi:MAG: hypothetical protein AAGC73_03070 [Verrucomicrobiota bacterium]
MHTTSLSRLVLDRQSVTLDSAGARQVVIIELPLLTYSGQVPDLKAPERKLFPARDVGVILGVWLI